MALWDDDPYSEDLFKQFHRVLGPDGFYRTLRPFGTAQEAALDWIWTAARLMSGGTPFGVEFAALRDGDLPLRPVSGQFVHIPFSVGTFTQPNPWEVEAAKMILDELVQHPWQGRPLLVLPAAPQPARRLLARAPSHRAPRGPAIGGRHRRRHRFQHDLSRPEHRLAHPGPRGAARLFLPP